MVYIYMYMYMCRIYSILQARAHSQSSAEYSVSQLNLVDLAGSERLNKTQVRPYKNIHVVCSACGCESPL